MGEKNQTFEERLIFVGGNIRKIRLDKKMTQADLAVKSDLDKQSIFRVEKGKLNITLQTIFKLADALEVKAEKLMFIK